MAKAATRLHVNGYQVMDYLGRGARSTIWRVRERTRNRFYALKRVYRQPGDDDRFFNQAVNEFEIARRFDHPGLRKYYRLRRVRRWFATHELHLFMELCEGQTCQARRPEEITRAATIFLEAARALTHVHRCGYVHGDIKPNNIIIADDGTVKIIDFGQSCPIGTVKDRIQGTPDFIAPEQVHRRPLDARTDVFNFGAALYWTLTAKAIPTVLPKNGNTVQLVSDLAVTPPDELNSNVPPAMNRLVLDCIEFTPTRRPQTMSEVAARLDLIAPTLGVVNGAVPAAPSEDVTAEQLDRELDDLFEQGPQNPNGAPGP